MWEGVGVPKTAEQLKTLKVYDLIIVKTIYATYGHPYLYAVTNDKDVSKLVITGLDRTVRVFSVKEDYKPI